MNTLILAIILWQTQTPTPRPSTVDPGNDPLWTAFFFVLFWAVILGGGVVFFRVRMSITNRQRNLEKETANKAAATPDKKA